MTDPFTSASPTYVAAQRTNQARETGWCFAPDTEEPTWLKALTGFLSAFRNPSVWIALTLLAGSIWLLVRF